MGRKFDIVYDDFTGGHFMGPSNANQPRNTWTGPNVICTADDGYLMPDGPWSTNLEAAAFDPSQFAPPSMGMPIAFPTATDPHTNPVSVFYTDGTGGGVIQSNPSTGGGLLTALPAVGAINSYVSVLNGSAAFVNGAGGFFAYLVTTVGGVTTVTTTANFDRGMWWWNSFAVGVTTNTSTWHRLFWSAPGDPTSWTATDYYEIGNASSPISTVIATNDALYVGKTEGWWVVTGVLGRTATVRRLTPTGVSGNMAAAAARSGILFRSERGPFLNVLRGTQVDHFAAFPYGSDVQMVVPSATDVVVMLPGATAAEASHMYIWSDAHRRWRHKPTPAPADIGGAISAQWWPVTDTDARTDYLRAVSNTTQGSGLNHLIYDWQAAREPLEPQSSAAGFNTAVATLAEYSATDPFRVHELIVEVDFGRPVDQQYARGLAAWVNTDSPPDLAQTFTTDDDGNAAKVASSALAQQWLTATNSRRGHRQTVRFNVNDGASSSYTAAPVVAMTGLKVRRVIMKCESV